MKNDMKNKQRHIQYAKMCDTLLTQISRQLTAYISYVQTYRYRVRPKNRVQIGYHTFSASSLVPLKWAKL